MAVTRKRSRSRSKNPLTETISIVIVAIALALGIQAFLIKPFRIPSESMVPTLSVGQRVLVDRVTSRFSAPGRGDIVVFNPPIGAEEGSCGDLGNPADRACPEPTSRRSDTNFIKRVVAGPGDRLKVIDGYVYINGKPQREPYVRKDANCPLCDLPQEIRIPPGHFFMMGDNRGESADSREWGPVPDDWIVGQAFFTYWPPDRIGLL
jgi:signal peptidase I